MKDIETLIDYLESSDGVSLLSDDDGRWAVSDAGFQPAPPEGGFTDAVMISCYVTPEEWKPTIREALECYFDCEDGE